MIICKTIILYPYKRIRKPIMTSTAQIDTTQSVLVTGATGYIAGVLIKELLDAGVTVHATVRNPSKKENFLYLQDIADNSPGTIRFFHGDLLEPGSFKEAMQGCAVVFHTASPFFLKADDPIKDLIEPAVNGAKNVLEQAAKTSSVKRVVMTSSITAVFGDASEVFDAPTGTFDESNWNRTSTWSYKPYSLSKTLAEQAAWVVAGSQEQFTLTVVCPSLVLGPGVKYHESSESFAIMKKFASGEFAQGCPEISVSVVDVRDVAHAHVLAAYHPSAGGRFLITGTDTNFLQMGLALGSRFPKYPFPKKGMNKWIIYLLAPYLPGGLTRKYVKNNIGIPLKTDNSKSKNVLEMTYRPMEDTLSDMFEQLLDEDVV